MVHAGLQGMDRASLSVAYGPFQSASATRGVLVRCPLAFVFSAAGMASAFPSRFCSRSPPRSLCSVPPSLCSLRCSVLFLARSSPKARPSSFFSRLLLNRFAGGSLEIRGFLCNLGLIWQVLYGWMYVLWPTIRRIRINSFSNCSRLGRFLFTARGNVFRTFENGCRFDAKEVSQESQSFLVLRSVSSHSWSVFATRKFPLLPMASCILQYDSCFLSNLRHLRLYVAILLKKIKLCRIFYAFIGKNIFPETIFGITNGPR